MFIVQVYIFTDLFIPKEIQITSGYQENFEVLNVLEI